MSERLIFAGTPAFAASMLSALLQENFPILAVLTQPDRPKGRGQSLISSPVKQIALEAKLPLLQPPNLKDPEMVATLHAFGATRFIVAAYGLLLPKTVLSIPPKGCLNVHASLLPRWRGAAPIQRALLAGDLETGITLMHMEAGLDTGPMLAKSTIPIQATDTYGSLHETLSEVGAHLLVAYLENVDTFPAPVLQESSLATYASKIQKEDLLLDWHKPAVLLERQVRAFSPHPACHTMLNNTLIKIHRASVGLLPSEHQTAVPGTLIDLHPSHLRVATGEGALLIEQLQFPGKKPMFVADLMRTRTLNLHRGMIFD